MSPKELDAGKRGRPRKDLQAEEGKFRPPGEPPEGHSASNYGSSLWESETRLADFGNFALVKGKKCPRCGQAYSWDKTHCEADGESLAEQSVFGAWIADQILDATTLSKTCRRSCPRCGRTYPFDVNRCPEDGALLEWVLRSKKDHAFEEPPKELLGRVVGGKWRLAEFISGGGFGWVFKGESLGLRHPVAIKVLKVNLAGSPRYRERFHAEATVLSQLDYPRIVRVIDYGEEEDMPYLVMQYLPEKPLRVFIQEDSLSLNDKVEIMRQVALALAEAHRPDPNRGGKPIVHLDLKPEHIFVRKQEGELHVTVIDFGIAEILTGGGKEEDSKGALRVVAGTPPYMAPERFDNAVGPLCDIYSFGIIFYELLAGRRPFCAADFKQFEHCHRYELAPPLRRDTRGERIPKALRRLIERCMAKDPAVRVQSAAALAAELQSFLTRTRWQRTTAAALVFLAVLAAGAGTYRLLFPPPGEMTLQPQNLVELHARSGSVLEASTSEVAHGEARLVRLGEAKPLLRAPLKAGRAVFNFEGLKDGDYGMVRVEARAKKNRLAARSHAFHLIVDTQPPEFLPLALAGGSGRLAAGKKADLWVSSSDALLRISVKERYPERVTVRLASGRLIGEGIGEVTFPAARLAGERSPVTIALEALDKAGNRATTAVSLKICETLELWTLRCADLPKAKAEGNPITELWSHLKALTLTGTVRGEPKAVTASINGGPARAAVVRAGEISGEYIFTLPVTGLGEGDNSVKLSLVDLLGRISREHDLAIHVRSDPISLQLKAKGPRLFVVCENVPVSGLLQEGKLTVKKSLGGGDFAASASLQETAEGFELERLERAGDGLYLLQFQGIDLAGREVTAPDLWCVVDTTAPVVEVLELEDHLGSERKPVFLDSNEKARVRLKVEDATPVRIEARIGDTPLVAIPKGRQAYLIEVPAACLRPFRNRLSIKITDHFGTAPPGTLWFPGKEVTRNTALDVYAMEKSRPAILACSPDSGEINFAPKLHIMLVSEWTAGSAFANGFSLQTLGIGEDGQGLILRRFEGTITPPPEGIINYEVVALRPEAGKTTKAVRVMVYPREEQPFTVMIKGMQLTFVFKLVPGTGPCFISRKPVTFAQFQRFVSATGRPWSFPADSRPVAPVRGVSRKDAEDFCAWIGNKCRLPRVREWKALAAAKSTKQLEELGFFRVYEWLADLAPDPPAGRLAGLPACAPVYLRNDIENYPLLKSPPEHRGIDFGFRVVMPFEEFVKLLGNPQSQQKEAKLEYESSPR